MYRVNVGVNLLAGNGMLGLSRWVPLPFPPYPGLDLRGLTSDPGRVETVVAVAWDVKQGCFFIDLFDCDSPDETVAELIDYYGPGWELHEPGFEPVPEE